MASDRDLQCPSATSKAAGAEIFGVLHADGGAARVAFLKQPVPARPDLLALTQPLAPEQVFRFTAPCARDGCANFGAGRCEVAMRLRDTLEPGERSLPPCGIRRQCLWWHQEGAAACRRCGQVATMPTAPSDDDIALAGAAGIARAEPSRTTSVG